MSTTPLEPILDADNTELSVTGAFYGGPIASTAPTTAVAPLTGYVCYGYTSEDGIEEQPSRSVDPLKAWQNNAVVQNVTTDGSVAYTVTFIETLPEVVELWHGAELDATGKLTFNPGFNSKKQRFVVDIIDAEGEVERHSFVGQVGTIDNRAFKGGELRGFPLTINVIGNVEKWFTRLATP